MPTPILELIAQNVATTLGGITTAGGYENTLTVERAKRLGNIPGDRRVVIHQGDARKESPEDDSRAHITWNQSFLCTAFAVESEASVTAIDQRINSLRADMEKALMVDPTRGGYALDTFIEDPINFSDEGGGWEGIVVHCVVKYRTLLGNPYSQ